MLPQNSSTAALKCRPIIVAGCGAMGLPMTQQLLRDGFYVRGFDIRPLPLLADNALTVLEPTSTETILMVVVRDEQQIDAVCFNDQAVFRRPVYPHTLIISSTVSPRYINTLSARLPSDVTLIDAPMSGAPHAARKGALSFMLGGPPSAVDELLPMFLSMGDAIHRLGATGQGMLAKVLNNYVAAASVVAVRRSLRRAADAGLDWAQLLEVMRHSSGSTWYGNQYNDIDWATEEYSADNTIGILLKDVSAALDVPGATDAFDQALLAALMQLPTAP